MIDLCTILSWEGMLQCFNASMLQCMKSNPPAGEAGSPDGRQGFSGANA